MNAITAIMLVFSVLGALDRIIGNKFGLGKEFERGFMLLGNMALSMIGMIVISPLLAQWLAPCFDWIYATFRIDPSIIPAAVFANDMGGAPLSKEIAQNPSIGMFSMMGCTISYTIPYALGVVKQEKQKELFLGFLCGFVTIPVGCLPVGLGMGIAVGPLLLNLLPLILFSGIIVCCLLLLPNGTVRFFTWFGVAMKGLITCGLVVGMLEFLLGKELLPGLATLTEASDICINAAVVLSGAFPLMFVVSKLLAKPIRKLGQLFRINDMAALGFVSSIVTHATSMEMINTMDPKGAVLNAAFAVSASFTFGGHLAFTMAFDEKYVLPMIAAKLIAGVSAVAVALLIYRRMYGKKQIETTIEIR